MKKLPAMLQWGAVPVLLALPTAWSVAGLADAESGWVSLAAGLGLTAAAARDQLDPERMEAARSFRGWGPTGWLGALLAVSPALGFPIWVAAIGWAMAWLRWSKPAWKGGGPWWPQAVVAVAGFPWLLYEMNAVGWFFRSSGAAVVGGLLKILGLSVEREGTMILAQGVPISVDVACSGLGALQAMALAGAALLPPGLRPGWRAFVVVAALLPLAWLANTVRIAVLAVVAVTFGPDVAKGPWHGVMGWVALMAVFVVGTGWLNRWIFPKDKRQ
jgi:exosortase/archaeosortase family protein